MFRQTLANQHLRVWPEGMIYLITHIFCQRTIIFLDLFSFIIRTRFCHSSGDHFLQRYIVSFIHQSECLRDTEKRTQPIWFEFGFRMGDRAVLHGWYLTLSYLLCQCLSWIINVYKRQTFWVTPKWLKIQTLTLWEPRAYLAQLVTHTLLLSNFFSYWFLNFHLSLEGLEK